MSISASADQTEQSVKPLALRAGMLRLAEVDWRMRVASKELCPRKASGIGLWLDHSSAYSTNDAQSLFRTLRLGGLPQVAAVASSSPAAKAGIRPGDEIEMISGMSMVDGLAKSPDPSLFVEDVMDFLATFDSGRPVKLVLRRGRTTLGKTVKPMPICAGRTVLVTDQSLEAHTDNKNIAVTAALVDFTANDDELALILGHEFAHVILSGEASTPTADSLSLERNADVLGSTIAHCAGYSMVRAHEFWQRFDAQDSFRQSRLTTHPSASEGEERMVSTSESVSCPVGLTSTVGH